MAISSKIDRLIVLIMFISFLAVFPLDVMLPSVPALADHFGVHPQAIAANIALFPMVYALGQLLAGAAADRYGSRAVLAIWVAVSACASLGAAWAATYQAFNGWRLLQAIGCAGFGLLHAVVQAHYPPSRRAALRIMLTTLAGVCISVSPLIGVFLHSLGGWQLSFLLYAAMASAVAVFAPIALAPDQQPSKQAIRGTLNRANFAFGTAGATLAFSVHFLFIVVSPLLFMERLGLGLWAYASVMLVYGFFYVIGGAIALRVAKMLGAQEQVRLGFAVIAAGSIMLLGLYLWVGLQTWVALLAAVVVTCGVCLARPAATCLAMDAWPGRPGAAAGWLGLLTFMGGGGLSLIATRLLSAGDQWFVSWLLLLGGSGLVLTLARLRAP